MRAAEGISEAPSQWFLGIAIVGRCSKEILCEVPKEIFDFMIYIYIYVLTALVMLSLCTAGNMYVC